MFIGSAWTWGRVPLCGGMSRSTPGLPCLWTPPLLRFCNSMVSLEKVCAWALIIIMGDYLFPLCMDCSELIQQMLQVSRYSEVLIAGKYIPQQAVATVVRCQPGICQKWSTYFKTLFQFVPGCIAKIQVSIHTRLRSEYGTWTKNRTQDL